MISIKIFFLFTIINMNLRRETGVFFYKTFSSDNCLTPSALNISSEEAAANMKRKRSELPTDYKTDQKNKKTKKCTSTKPPKYVPIKFSIAIGNVKKMKFNISPCDCDPNKPNPCGAGSDCINRMLMIECQTNNCPAGDKCLNQRFKNTSYPKLVPFLTSSKGWGLKTLEDINQGSFVIEYVGDIIDKEEFQRRCKEMHKSNAENYYLMAIDSSRTIDAGRRGNVSRFMNHSCEPNCVTQKWTVNGDTRIGLFALHDIQADTELVFDYCWQSFPGVQKKPCQCGAAKCSKFLGVKVEKEQKKIVVVNDGEKCKASAKSKRKPLKLKKSNRILSTTVMSGLNVTSEVNVDDTNAENVNFSGTCLGNVMPEFLPNINKDQLNIDTNMEIKEEEYTVTQVFKDEFNREYLHIGGFNKSNRIVSTTVTSGLNVTSEVNVDGTNAEHVNFAGTSLGNVMSEFLPNINEDQLNMDTNMEINKDEYMMTQVIKDEFNREYLHIGGFNVCNIIQYNIHPNMSDLRSDRAET